MYWSGASGPFVQNLRTSHEGILLAYSRHYNHELHEDQNQALCLLRVVYFSALVDAQNVSNTVNTTWDVY